MTTQYTTEQLQILKTLATFTDETLNTLRISQIREQFRVLLTGNLKASKVDAIKLLIGLRDKYLDNKKQDLVFVKTYLETLKSDTNYCEKLFLRDITAVDFVDSIWEYWTLTKSYSITTIAKAKKNEISNLLTDLRNAYSESNQWCKEVYTLISEKIKPLNQEINREYDKKVETYGQSDTLTYVTGNHVIDWCNKILKAFTDDKFTTKTKRWYETSLALALTSGRRMVEIHGNVCQFSKGFENDLVAVGLAKKSDDDFELESPCLVDVDLWLDAYDKLPTTCKNLDDKKINQTISTNLSKSLRNVYSELGIEKYKDARDFYIAYCLDNLYKGELVDGKRSNFLKKLVGHESKKIGLSYEKISIQ